MTVQQSISATPPSTSLADPKLSFFTQPDRVSTESQTLRVMTYNIHSCIGMDGKVSPGRIARMITQYTPAGLTAGLWYSEVSFSDFPDGGLRGRWGNRSLSTYFQIFLDNIFFRGYFLDLKTIIV